MPDNLGYTPGSGANIASDDIGGIQHQRIKMVLGADGVSDGDVSASNPMPAKVVRAEDLLSLLERLVKISETLQVVDSSQRQRITLDNIPAGVTLPTVTTVGTVTTVTTVSTVSSVTNVAAQTALAGMDREMYINIAKQTYAQSIRANLKIQ